VIVTVGVLALQGAFVEHMEMLTRLGVRPREVRRKEDLAGLDGLIIPGGESTVMGKLGSSQYSGHLLDELGRLARAGLPSYGTCAGMVLLAKEVLDGREGQSRIAAMDIVVRRNAFGRAYDSFTIDLSIPVLDAALGSAEVALSFPALFLRAPVIEKAEPGVDIVATLDDGTSVAARQDHLLVSSFHPELTNDTRFHEYFLGMIAGRL
jgi:5'-phosphate synthase pdxT subunit